MKIVEDFIEGNSRKSQAYEQHLLVSIYNSRLKSNVLIIIVKHYFIITYNMQ